jgi:hypothetical protein
MSVTRLWHSRHYISIATVIMTAVEELWEAVFSVGCIWRTKTDVESVEWLVVSSRDYEWVCRQLVLASGEQTLLGARQWPGVVAMKSCCEPVTGQYRR